MDHQAYNTVVSTQQTQEKEKDKKIHCHSTTGFTARKPGTRTTSRQYVTAAVMTQLHDAQPTSNHMYTLGRVNCANISE